MRIKVDIDLCQGHSVCLSECPEVFAVEEQEDGYPVVSLLIEQPDEGLREKVQNACDFCPNKVLSIVED
jgi:ferredoxin